MTPPTPKRPGGKGPRPIYVVVMHNGKIDYLTVTAKRRLAAEDAKLFPGDRVVKYVPSLPRKAKGARRGK